MVASRRTRPATNRIHWPATAAALSTLMPRKSTVLSLTSSPVPAAPMQNIKSKLIVLFFFIRGTHSLKMSKLKIPHKGELFSHFRFCGKKWANEAKVTSIHKRYEEDHFWILSPSLRKDLLVQFHIWHLHHLQTMSITSALECVCERFELHHWSDNQVRRTEHHCTWHKIQTIAYFLSSSSLFLFCFTWQWRKIQCGWNQRVNPFSKTQVYNPNIQHQRTHNEKQTFSDLFFWHLHHTTIFFCFSFCPHF